jgi:hypothetical protein
MDTHDEHQTIRIQVGKVVEKLVDHWSASTTVDECEGVTVSYSLGSTPKGGLALAIPPEVVLAFAKDFAEEIGKAAGKLVWDRLRAFFLANPSDAPRQGKVITPDGVITFDPANRPEQPPQPKPDGPI